MRINTDTITTGLGAIMGIAGLTTHYGIYPDQSAAVGALAFAMLGFFTNKASKK